MAFCVQCSFLMAFVLWTYFLSQCNAQLSEPEVGDAVARALRENVPQSSDDSSPTCISCQKSAIQLTAEEMYTKKIEQEKLKILHKLMLSDPPNVTVDQHDIPSVLRKRIAEDFSKTNAFDPDDVESEDVEMFGKTKNFFIFGEHPKRGGAKSLQCLTKDGKTAACIDLKLSHEISVKEILNASLWIHKCNEPNQDTDRRHVIRIAEVHRHHNKLVPDEEVIEDVETTLDEGWMEIDVTALVESWRKRKHPSRRHNTLQISCVTCTRNVLPPIATSADQRPFLEVKAGLAPSRKKRSNVCSPELYSNCCLKPFYVNFTEIGWNSWIIQPPGYYANYCTGSCRMSSTNPHTSVVRTVGLTKEVRGENYDRELIPCCSPTKMSPLSLLYAFNAGEIRKKVLDNMIVKSCGC